jgi:hypothetical protein
MSTRVVFILGLSRSGSTYLEFLLARHGSIVGVGELDHVMRAGRESPEAVHGTRCSCGALADSCPLWGNILPALDPSDDIQTLRTMIEQLSQSLPDKVLVDSSKTRQALQRYASLPGIELRILFLVRDFRGWTWSVKNRRAVKGQTPPGRVSWGYRWLYSNVLGLAGALRSRHPLLLVSYENLVFHREVELARIGSFLELDLAGSQSKRPVHHNLFGNPMKLDPRKATTTVYDDSWKQDRRQLLAAPLLAPVHLVNVLVRNLSRARG